MRVESRAGRHAECGLLTPHTWLWMGKASSMDGRSASIIVVSPKSYTMCSRMSLSAYAKGADVSR